MKNNKENLNMWLFDFLKEVTLLNNKALLLQYDNGTNSHEILFEGSKNLPRKQKKKIRQLIRKQLNKIS